MALAISPCAVQVTTAQYNKLPHRRSAAREDSYTAQSQRAAVRSFLDKSRGISTLSEDVVACPFHQVYVRTSKPARLRGSPAP
jgi:hypothetical protein